MNAGFAWRFAASSMTNAKSILIVADNLAEFRRTNPCFDSLGHAWEVEYSQSKADALFCVRRSGFDLIFVELAAGPKAGADLVCELRLRLPNAVYFLLGPEMDPEVLIACAKLNLQFLQKPLQEEVLQTALGRAELVHQILQDLAIQKLIGNIRIFPSRPKVYLDLMRELRSPMSSAQSVGEIVEQDLGISTKLLQVTNSAYFGLQQRISSPTDAVVHLGMETTASLVLALEVFAHFDHLHPNYFAMDHVWRHSQTVAENARRIAGELSGNTQAAQDAYTAGLLHDIGKLALAINIKEEYGGVLRLGRHRGIPVWQAEFETFGTTHATVGAYLLALWGMPAAVVQAVASHHDPASQLSPAFSAVGAVHLANMLEYNRVALRNAFQGLRLDLDYPVELGFQQYLPGNLTHPRSTSEPRFMGALGSN